MILIQEIENEEREGLVNVNKKKEMNDTGEGVRE